MSAPVIYRGGGFEVTDTLLRTPRKTFKLAQVEYVRVHRPLLLFAGVPAGLLIGFCGTFWRYLLVGEAVAITALSAAAIVAAFRFGVLQVHSLAFRDGELGTSFGPIGRLREVRAAVEAAMSEGQGRGIRE